MSKQIFSITEGDLVFSTYTTIDRAFKALNASVKSDHTDVRRITIFTSKIVDGRLVVEEKKFTWKNLLAEMKIDGGYTGCTLVTHYDEGFTRDIRIQPQFLNDHFAIY